MDLPPRQSSDHLPAHEGDEHRPLRAVPHPPLGPGARRQRDVRFRSRRAPSPCRDREVAARLRMEGDCVYRAVAVHTGLRVGPRQPGGMTRRRAAAALLFLALLAAPRSAPADSVLAHEAMIDAAWDSHLAPLLRTRFPRSSVTALQGARAYAYGGSLIQDLGYYPFGSRFFSNLVHYVRSGDFVEALVRESQTVNEYAFALGALAHYASDNAGHSIAVNRAVPIVYPKLREEFGDEVLYADSPGRHI